MIDCEKFNSRLSNFVDGALSEVQQQSMQQHTDNCKSCRLDLLQEKELLQAMNSLPAPRMRPGFAQKALRRAVEQNRQQHRRGFAKGFGSAMVAGLALWVTAAVFMPAKDLTQPGLMQVALSLHQERTVNLAFYAPKAMENARLSFVLPDHLEVIGFPNQREITWVTSLDKGQNVLALPLKANAAVDTPLVTKVESGGDVKTFEVQINVIKAHQAMSVKTAETWI